MTFMAAHFDGEESTALETVDDGEDERVLNQDEIDSLLDGFSGDEEQLKGIKAVIESGVVSYERLPVLEVVFDRLVRLLSTSLRNFTSDNVDVHLQRMTSIRFADYIDSIPLPAMMNVFKVEEWDGSGMITVDNALIYSIVDVLLGGRNDVMNGDQTRQYTTIERNLIERMVTLILKDFTNSFEPVEDVHFSYDRLETNPRFATIVRPGNAAIIASIRVDMEDRGGCFDVLLPYATLEPVREKLLQMFVGEKMGHDTIWEHHLGEEVWNSEIHAEVILDQVNVNLSDVLKWKKGTQLSLEAFPEDTVIARVGEKKLFSGTVGNHRSRVAVQVDKNFLTEPES
ncbi:MAG: flagellar motor switch protein FliM [Alphaproteobacteria bacterium]